MIGSHEKLRKRIVRIAPALLVLPLLLMSCGNIFQVGLGASVDIDRPTVSLTSHKPGTYLKNTVTFSGKASDDQGLASLEISFDGGTSWGGVDLPSGSDTWSYQYDTTSRTDGRLRVMVRATDLSDKSVTTDELVFNIDNTPPVVLVTGPRDYTSREFNTLVSIDVAVSDIDPIKEFGIDIMDDSGNVLATETETDQSASPWSFSFASADYYPAGYDPLTATDPFRFTYNVYAIDDAGNRSAFFFHTDDVRTNNNQKTASADQLAAILYPNAVEDAAVIKGSATITRATLLSIELDDTNPFYLDFDENLDVPSISVTQPNLNGSSPYTVPMNGVIQGSVRDDDAVAAAYPKIKLWADPLGDGGTEPASWTDLREVGDSTTPSIYDFEYPLPADQAGKYRLSIVVQDVNGVQASIDAVPIVITAGAPTLTIDTPANNSFQSGTFTIGGTSTHDAGQPTIDLSFDDGATYEPAFSTTAAPAGAWSFSINTGTIPLADGEYTFRVRATSPTAVQNSQVLGVTIDNEAPTLAFTEPVDGATVNGVLTLSGTADDNAQIDTVEYYDPVSSSWQTFPTRSTWNTTIDTTALADGALALQVRVTDRAGNQFTDTENVTVAQGTDAPVIALTNATAGGDYADNVLTGPIYGTVTDDDKVNSSSIQYEWSYSADGDFSASSWSAWAPVSSTGTGTTSVTFQLNLGETTDGFYQIAFRASDDASAKDGKAAITTTLPASPVTDGVKFLLDNAPPAITVSNLAGGIQQGGVTVTHQDLTVTGTATDAIGVAAVEYRVVDSNGAYPLGSWASTDTTPASLGPGVTSASWQAVVAVGGAGLPDGEYSLELRATDGGDKQITTTRQFVVDTSAPTASIDTPTASGTANGTITIRGVSSDTNQVAKSYYLVQVATDPAPTTLPSVLGDGTDVPNGWTPFSSAYGWNASWDTYAFQQSTQGDFVATDYTVYAIARDTAGNVSNVDSSTITIDQESDRPTLTITNLAVPGQGIPSPVGTAPTNLLTGTGIVSGTITDDDGVDGADIQFRYRSYDLDTTSWGALSGWTDLSTALGGTSYSGVRTSGSFSYAVPTGLGEGIYEIEFRAIDALSSGSFAAGDYNWNTTGTAEFAYDSALPALALDAAPVDGSYHSGDFSVTGTASDGNGLNTVEIDDGTGITAATLGAGTWSFTAPVAGDGTTDATAEYTIRATDRFGRTRELTRTFVRDATAPTTPTIAAFAAAYQANELVANGTATDATSGVALVEYSFDGSTWNPVTGTNNWFATVDISSSGANLTEGGKTLSIRSTDRAGNVSAIATRAFIVDRNNPALAITGGNTVVGTTYLNTTVSLSGTVSDANGVGSVTVSYAKDGGSSTQILNDTDGNGTWSTSLAPSGDGEYVFTVTATDGVGKQSALTRTVRIDSVDPDAEITSVTPVVGTSTVNGKITIRAAIADDIALASTKWAILPQGSAPIAADYTAVTGTLTAPIFAIDTTTTTSNVVVNSGTPFDRTLTDTATSTFWIEATDRAGNTTEISLDLDVDQSSDLPQISFTTIDDTANTPAQSSANLIESNALVRFVVTDDDLIDASTMEISVGDDTSWVSVNHNGGAVPADAKSITTNHNLYLPTMLAEGTTNFYLRVQDAASAKDGLASVQRVVGPIYVMVDRNFPTVTETDLGGDVYRSALYSMSGSIGDTNALASIAVTESVDGGAAAQILSTALSGTSDTWTVANLPTGGVADGSYAYAITVLDASGKQTVLTRTVTIDTTAPSAPAVTDPTADEWLGSSTYVFTGTSDDGAGSGVASIYWYESGRGAGTPAIGDPAWTEVTAAPDGSWSATVSVGASGLRDFSAYAVDDAGNPSAITTRAFGLDLNAPVVSASDGTSTAYENGDFSVTGTFTDISGLASVGVESSTDNLSFVAAVPATASFDNTAHTWTWNRTIGAQSDGTYYYRFTFTDLAGNDATLTKTVNLDRTAPVISFDAASPSIGFDGVAATADANGTMSLSGTVTENQGTANLDTMAYRLDGGSWTSLTVNGTFVVSGIDTTLYPDLSDLIVDIRAIDRNGNETITPFTFGIDQSTDKPVVTVTSPANGSTVGTVSTTVTGTVTDDDGIPSSAGAVQYRFSPDNGTTWGSWTNITVTGAATSRSFTFALSSGTDGDKAVEFRATDTGGIQSDVTPFALTFDTSAPEITLSGPTPTDGSYVTGNFTVSGTAADTNGVVASLEYRVIKDGSQIVAFTPVTTVSPALPSASSTFSQTIDTSSGTGQYQVEIRATDDVSLVRVQALAVYVDKSVPTISFASPTGGSTQNNIITISGTAADNYGVASVDVVVMDGATPHALPTGAILGLETWSISGFDTRDSTLLSYATDLGGGAYEVTLRASVTDVAGNVTTTSGSDLVFQIDQSTDVPVVTFDDIAFDGSSTITSGVIRGTASDDDGVAAIAVDVYAVDDSITTETVVLTSGSYGQKDLAWRVNLSSLENGAREIRVRVTDTVNNDANSLLDTGRVGFLLDTENPDVAVSTPSANVTWSANNTFTITGTAGDETGISALAYKIDDNDFSGGSTSIPDTNTDGWQTWAFTIPQASLANGAHTIYVQATDSVANTRIASRQLSVDKNGPTISVTSPANGSAVFGPLTIGGTATDNAGGAGVASVAVGLGRQIDAGDLAGSTWTAVAGTTSWSFGFLNINDYANTTYAYNTGDTNEDGIEDVSETWTDIWNFTFYVRALDAAGDSAAPNASYLTSYTLQIDPKRDRPEISIFSPSDGATVGGFVRVFGSAFDSQFVDKVQIAIDANNDGDYTNDTWAEGTLDETDAGVNWYLANGTTSWSVNLNENGEFDPAGVETTRTIAFKVRAKDYKVTPGDGIYGAEEQYSLTFNKDFPQFGAMSIASGATVGGTVTLTGIVRDETDVQRIIFSNEGPLLNNTIIFNNPGGLMPPGASNTDVSSAAAISAGITVTLLGTSDPEYNASFPGSYRINVPIDTEAAGLYPNGAGSMSVKVTAEDTTTPSPFTNQQLISFSVDNVDPSNLAYTGGAQIVGTSAELQGTVRDTGTVSGIDRVVVYLTNAAGDIIRLQGGTGTIGGFTESDVLDGANATYHDYRMVIDDRLEEGNDGGAAGDADGIPEYLTLSAGTYQWSGLFNSTLAADGVVTVHMIADDYAGNRTTTTSIAFIANNGPSIDSIVLGTDLDGSTVVDGDELTSPITTGYSATNFTARNGLLYIGVNASAGNGTLRYSVTHLGVEQNAVLVNNTLVIDTTGYAESSATNDTSLVITVYDSTSSDDADATNELWDTVTVNLTIDNVDDVAPSISIAPFGQTYNESSDDSAKSLGGVSSYEDNVVMASGERKGHVEYAADSLPDNVDADLSGEVIFRGKSEDNQHTKRITATIPGYNGGAAFDIYDATGSGALSGTDWTFAIDGSAYLTEAQGDVFNWTFAFNTAAIAATTASDTSVIFTVYDYNPTANGGLGNSGSSSIQVDVVPYVTSVERDPAYYSTFRSKWGAYPIQQNETGVLVHGFNLLDTTTQDANNWARIYNTAESAFQALSITAAAATKDELTVSFTSVSASGYLRISVNGITDSNRTNDDTLEYNKEDDGNGLASTLWNDNRYVSIWQVGDYFSGSNDPQHPSMDIRQSNGRIYGAWSNYAASAAYYARPALTQATGTSTLFQTYDPPEWTDIAVEAGANTVHSVILENYYGGTNTTDWGFLASRINTGSRVALDDMGNNSVNAGIDHSDGYDEQLYQFQNPRIVVSNEGTNQQYIAYYDAWAKAVKYSIATNGAVTFTAASGHMTDSATVVDGQDDFDNDPSDSGADVGQYLDIQMDPDDGVPVIVYYDTTNKTMKIARGQSAQPNGTAQWNIANVLPVNSFSGQYVSMKVDSDAASSTYGDLFISFYKVSTGDLMFIHATDVDGTGAGVFYTFDSPVALDTEGAVGPWSDIYLVDGYPVISYLNSTQIGTYSGLKVARYIGDGSSWTNSDDWEHEVVPADDAVFNMRTNIVGLDAAYAGAWNIAVGYASSYFNVVFHMLEQ